MIATYLLAPASLMTPFTYAQMIWAVLYGYLIFDQLPDRWSALGIAVIVLSGVLSRRGGTPPRIRDVAHRRYWHSVPAGAANSSRVNGLDCATPPIE